MGNLNSVKKKLLSLKAEVVVTSQPSDLLEAQRIVLPGVGHFAMAMNNLRELGLIDALNEAVIRRHVPILGICLGMQLMARSSEEGGVEGLGWFDADVRRFQISDKLKFKVPHMGWNQVVARKPSHLLRGIAEGSEFYFVHSYHMQADHPTDVLAESDYELPFTCAVEKGNMFGVQFHPEKSHNVGQALVKNFLELSCSDPG